MKYLNGILCLLMLIVFSACKKKHCDGTNTISGRIMNGTTLQGIIGFSLKIQYGMLTGI